MNVVGTNICQCIVGEAFNESTGKCEKVCLYPNKKNVNGECEAPEILCKDGVVIKSICYKRCDTGYTMNEFGKCIKDTPVCE